MPIENHSDKAISLALDAARLAAATCEDDDDGFPDAYAARLCNRAVMYLHAANRWKRGLEDEQLIAELLK